MKYFVLASIENENKQKGQEEYAKFNVLFQEAVLLALFHQKKLTQWQFDRCMELLHKQLI